MLNITRSFKLCMLLRINSNINTLSLITQGVPYPDIFFLQRVLINIKLTIYYRKCKIYNLSGRMQPQQERDYLVTSAVCFLSAKCDRPPSFFLMSCEGANYPAAYQLKTMPGAKGTSIICEQRAKAAGIIIKDAGASS